MIDDDVAQWRVELFHAIEHDDIEGISAVAARGDVNFVEEHSGFTPLMLAVDIGAQVGIQRNRALDTSFASTLLRHGASPTLKSPGGIDAADVARGYWWHEAIDVMHEFDPDGVPRPFWPLGYENRRTMLVPVPHDEDTPWRSELMDAVKRTDVERAHRLLAEPDSTIDFVHPGSSCTPLQLAISEQGVIRRYLNPNPDATIVRLLLDAGASPDFTPTSTRSPLDQAERWPEVRQLLLDAIGS